MAGRPELARALDDLDTGDELVIAEWGRATRSMWDGLQIIKAVIDAGASIKVLDRSYIDLETPMGRGFMAMMSAMAEDERLRIIKRTHEGRQIALAKGVRMGRKPKLDSTPDQGSAAAPRQGRADARPRQELRREHKHDFEIGRVMIEPAVTPPIDGEYSEQWQHVKYRHLILLDKDFIVFIDDDLDVDWQTTEAYDTRGHKNETQHNDILNAVARLEATPCSELPYSIRLQYKRLVGEGIARSLAHDYGNAKTILHTAEKYIRDRSEETSRYWYLTASTVMAALALAIGMLVVIFRDRVIAVLGRDGTWLCVAVAAGSAGALLSVIARSGKLKFDSSAGRRLHYLEGASRIWAGGLSGFVVALAMQSGFILYQLAVIRTCGSNLAFRWT